MSGIAIIVLLEIIAPVVMLIVYGRIKIARARRKAGDSEPAPVPVFDPKPEPTPGFFLSRFSTPQRAYLRQQITLGKSFYYIATYIFTALFTVGLLPMSVDRYGTEHPLAQRVWYSYLDHMSEAEFLLVFIMILAAVFTVGVLKAGGEGIFDRTRPVTHRFLFWARVAPAMTTIGASLVTAMAVSFVLLLIFYGPVWLHLSEAVTQRTVSLGNEGMDPAWLLQTSAPLLLLSVITSTLLYFCAGVLLFVAGSWFPNTGRIGTGVCVGVVGFCVAHFAGFITGPSGRSVAHMLFMYTSLGSPPPRAYMLSPIVACAAFLLLAQVLVRRVEF